jgi:hypothetical protein
VNIHEDFSVRADKGAVAASLETVAAT